MTPSVRTTQPCPRCGASLPVIGGAAVACGLCPPVGNPARVVSDVSVAGTCIEWTAGRDQDGYGCCRSRGRRYRAHRLAWERVHGPIPEGLFVLHRCDNPPCVNVAHLFLGTQADNMRDAKDKGRLRPPPLGSRLGSRNHFARLTEADVRSIRDRLAADEDRRSVAAAFGVHEATIRDIRDGRRWRHVTGTHVPRSTAADDRATPLRGASAAVARRAPAAGD